MAARSILASYDNAIKDIGTLEQYLAGAKLMEPKYQYLISEVVLLRLFSILEYSFADIAYKLACGAQYRNGSAPKVLAKCSSHSDAVAKMLSHGRPKKSRPQYLKWTTAKSIENSVKYVLDISDKYFFNINAHSLLIDEMRVVRNHIAHKTPDTKSKYSLLIRRAIGASAKIPVGVFLTSTSTIATARIETYVKSSKIVLGDIS